MENEKEMIPAHKKKFIETKFQNLDPELKDCGRVYFLSYTPYIPHFSGGHMYKQERTINLLDFGFYWRQFKGFFLKPFEKRINRRNKLKRFDEIWEENKTLKMNKERLELKLWQTEVRLKEAYRLFESARKDEG